MSSLWPIYPLPTLLRVGYGVIGGSPIGDVSIGFLTGEVDDLPRRQANMAEVSRATALLSSAFVARGGLPLYNKSDYRSFASQAQIVANFLRSLGLDAQSTQNELRSGLLQNLQTRSIPGFSRHHWGTEIDVLSTDRNAWLPGGGYSKYIDLLAWLVPNYGLFNPYVEGAFDRSRPHYNPEPWHLSLVRAAVPLQAQWLAKIGDVPSELSALLDRAAAAIAANGNLNPIELRKALQTIDLVSYVRNTAPPPVPQKPIKTSHGAPPYVPSGLANGTLNARLADTFRNQLALAQQRGDTSAVQRISQILTSHGAALS